MASAVRPLKAALVWLHKWLGVTLALLFLMWFVSGIVLYFVPYPNLGQMERLSALPPLPTDGGPLLTADEAASRAGLKFSEARLGMWNGQAVWRLLAGSKPAWVAVDARKSEVLDVLEVLAPADASAAAPIAQAFSGRKAQSVEMLERDQWTVPQGLDPYRPLFKVALDGGDGLELYVSAGSREVVRDTRRAERFWNWLGAVPHWIYPTVLRQFPKAWNQVVVWLSIPGIVLALTGVVLGVWQLFLNRHRWIPYRKFWMRWHHMVGLTAGVVTVTWIFSGLMSMNPFGVFSPRGELRAERAAWAGQAARPSLGPSDALAAAAAGGVHAREMEIFSVGGQAWYRLRSADGQMLVRADGDAQAEAMKALPEDLIRKTLGGLRPDAGQASVELLTQLDDQYYRRAGDKAEEQLRRPLPVWRASWDDGTAIYADAASGRIVLRVDESRRWQRVLYNGLHSFDFAPLLARPWLRDLLVVGLSLFGIGLCITSLVVAWRVIVSKRRARAR